MHIFSLEFLIQIHDDHLQHEQALINILRLRDRGLILDP